MAQPQSHPETNAERNVRSAWEIARIAEGDADAAAGRVIKGQETLDWLDRWTAGEEMEDPAVR